MGDGWCHGPTTRGRGSVAREQQEYSDFATNGKRRQTLVMMMAMTTMPMMMVAKQNTLVVYHSSCKEHAACRVPIEFLEGFLYGFLWNACRIPKGFL